MTDKTSKPNTANKKHSHKKLWAVVIVQFIVFLFLFLATDANIADFNKKLDSFNTDQYRESIRKVIQEDIDKSFKKYQADLDKSIANYESSAKPSTDLDTKMNNLIRYAELKLDSRINILESTVKYLQSQVDSLRVDVAKLK